MLVGQQICFINLILYSSGVNIEAILNSLVVLHDINVMKVSHIGNATDDFLYTDNGVSYILDSLEAIEFKGNFLHFIVTDGFFSLL